MNRNVESHFSSVPRMEHKRSSFDRSFSHKLTGTVGEVIPIYTQEVLPGDTVSLNTSKLVRFQTMLTPVMDNIYMDTYFFFCPNRILWKHWKEFMGENTSSAWIPSVEYTVPRISAPSGGFDVGTIADYMGYPVKTEWSASYKGAPTSLPFRAYALICNDFFRDQNLNLPNVVDDGDNSSTGSNGYSINNFQLGGKPYKAAKFHDYFTSCTPAPQKGPDVNIASNISGRLPVLAWDTHGSTQYNYNGVDTIVPMSYSVGTGALRPDPVGQSGGASGDYQTFATLGFSNRVPFNPTDTVAAPNNLWAYFNNPVVSDASAEVTITVNSLRIAVLTQMYYESLARAGSRYEEQLEQFFGVTNPDGRMNHPEYLGGNRCRINVHEVTNTAQSETDFLGDVGAQSATADSHSDFTKSFTEHGWLIGVCVVRYDHSYCQGMPAQFTRTSKFDFYNPLFALIGEQPVYNHEIHATKQNLQDKSIFGYQEAWASYRYSPNMASGYMRVNVQNSLSNWSLADNYASTPTLSSSWIKEDPTNVDRVLAVTSSVAPQFWVDFYFEAKWVRPMPMFSVPGAIGAF